MEVYIKKTVSEKPEKAGWYVVTDLIRRDMDKAMFFDGEHWEQYLLNPIDKFYTHYLIPIEANVLTDEELEEVKKKARDEVWNEPLY